MKKKFLLLLIFIFGINHVNAEKLIYIKLNSPKEATLYHKSENVKVHFAHHDFLLATIEDKIGFNHMVIDEDGWKEGYEYTLIWGTEKELSSIKKQNVIFSTENFVLVKLPRSELIDPAFSSKGAVRITEREFITVSEKTIHKINFRLYENEIKTNPLIASMVSQVSEKLLEEHIQHLQDYKDRRYDSEKCIEAQNWLEQKYKQYGLETELQSVVLSPSKNVIAIIRGTTHPEEYIICGAHYDSTAPEEVEAPGADDNATGTASMLEIARILSQYSFEKSIIICSFTAEEVGLWGSTEYATFCKNNDMEILGYINIDMSGYVSPLKPVIKIPVAIGEDSSELFEYYKKVTNTYLPQITMEAGELAIGTSDHASFNRNGYMAIFPFENAITDLETCNPYFHTPADILGLSVNSLEQVKIFAQACLATVADIAIPSRPTNITNSSTSTTIIEVYPNPVSDYLYINSTEEIRSIQIYTLLGKLTEIIPGNTSMIELTDYPNGIYFLKVILRTQEEFTYKVIKK